MPSDYSQRYGLFRRWYPKPKQWAVDQDYAHKLSEGDRAWLDRFNREYHAGDMRAGDPKNVHSSLGPLFEFALRRDCYARNNKQNRDLFSLKAASGLLRTDDVAIAHVISEHDILDSIDRARFRASVQILRAIRYARSFLAALQSIG